MDGISDISQYDVHESAVRGKPEVGSNEHQKESMPFKMASPHSTIATSKPSLSGK
jgi:hypothetical protein